MCRRIKGRLEVVYSIEMLNLIVSNVSSNGQFVSEVPLLPIPLRLLLRILLIFDILILCLRLYIDWSLCFHSYYSCHNEPILFKSHHSCRIFFAFGSSQKLCFRLPPNRYFSVVQGDVWFLVLGRTALCGHWSYSFCLNGVSSRDWSWIKCVMLRYWHIRNLRLFRWTMRRN